MLRRVYETFACPWIWPSLKRWWAIDDGYYRGKHVSVGLVHVIVVMLTDASMYSL